MLKTISDLLYPPAGAPPPKFIRAGLINLGFGLLIFALFFVAMAVSGSAKSIHPAFGFAGFMLWAVGVHYLLWRGKKSEVQLVNLGKTAATAVTAFASLMLLAGLVGLVATGLKHLAHHSGPL